MAFKRVLVLVRGGGDLASGVIFRLVRSGFPVLVTELAQPLAIRRTVAFASAVFENTIEIEGLVARRIAAAEDAADVINAGEIPVLVDAAGAARNRLRPAVVVDARLAKRNLGTTRNDAPLVIGLGPGFWAGEDCHAVIETNRGHYLGRVITEGSAQPDTGSPGAVRGHTRDRVLRAPADGRVLPMVAIGDRVQGEQIVAVVGGQPITAPFDGILRGLIHPAVNVKQGLKVGDVDPRGERDYCFRISDKSLAVGGGVLEAILSAQLLLK